MTLEVCDGLYSSTCSPHCKEKSGRESRWLYTLQYMYLVNNRSVQVRTGIWQNLDVSYIGVKEARSNLWAELLCCVFGRGTLLSRHLPPPSKECK